MKRFAILVLSLFLGCEVIWGSTYYCMGPDVSEKTKVEIIQTNGHQTTLRPRSLRPEPTVSITAELFADQLFFYFDDPVGEIAIKVTDSFGQVVGACSCDTDFQPMTVLIVPTDPGFYTIDLDGANFTGYGEYTRQ